MRRNSGTFTITQLLASQDLRFCIGSFLHRRRKLRLRALFGCRDVKACRTARRLVASACCRLPEGSSRFLCLMVFIDCRDRGYHLLCEP